MRKQNTRVVWGQEARKFATRRKLTSHKQWSRNERLDMATGTRWCGQIVANRVGKETRFRYHFGTDVKTTSTSRSAYFVWWSLQQRSETALVALLVLFPGSTFTMWSLGAKSRALRPPKYRLVPLTVQRRPCSVIIGLNPAEPLGIYGVDIAAYQ
jgi:hypothetical protein